MKKIEIINNESTKSEIVIDYDLTKNIYDYLDENKKYFLITNTTLAKLYPDIISKFNNNKANFYSDITESLLSSDAPKILSLLDVAVLEQEKGVKTDEIKLNSGKTASIRINENPLRADLQTELKLPDGSVIYGNHAYSVKGYNPDTKEVTITNPYENSTDIIIPFEIIKLFGIAM